MANLSLSNFESCFKRAEMKKKLLCILINTYFSKKQKHILYFKLSVIFFKKFDNFWDIKTRQYMSFCYTMIILGS